MERDDQDAEQPGEETPDSKRTRLAKFLAKHQVKVAGQRRKRLFFILLSEGYAAWADDPSECAFVLAGYAVQGVNGCTDHRAWRKDAARQRAHQMAASRGRQGVETSAALPLEVVVRELRDMLLEHVRSGVNAVDENGWPLHGVRQQAAQLGREILNAAIKAQGSEDDLKPEEKKVLRRLEKTPAGREAA